MSVVEVTGVNKSFGQGQGRFRVLEDVSFRCERGEVTSIVGPSGCGKSTLLNIISGLECPDDGQVQANQGVGFAYMMQDTMMLPWRTLAENALLGTEVRHGRSKEDRGRVEEYFTAFDMKGMAAFYPNASSGGMKQRTAMIRTLLTRPDTLLLDEPFSSLDFDVKLRVQRHILAYHDRANATTVIVTHDIDDAIALSDRVIVLTGRPAKVKQIVGINLRTGARDPVAARKSSQFREYFAKVWDEIMLSDNGGKTAALD